MVDWDFQGEGRRTPSLKRRRKQNESEGYCCEIKVDEEGRKLLECTDVLRAREPRPGTPFLEEDLDQVDLKVPIKYSDERYFCTENSLASLLAYLGEDVSPHEVADRRCQDFETASSCLSPCAVRGSLTIEQLKCLLKANHPVLLSVIPDANVQEAEKKKTAPSRHTVLLKGFEDEEFAIIDDGRERVLNQRTLLRQWDRTGRDAIFDPTPKKTGMKVQIT